MIAAKCESGFEGVFEGLDSNPVERKARGEFHLGRAECERKTLSVTTGPTQGLFGGRPDLVPRVKTYLEKSRAAHLWYT